MPKSRYLHDGPKASFGPDGAWVQGFGPVGNLANKKSMGKLYPKTGAIRKGRIPRFGCAGLAFGLVAWFACLPSVQAQQPEEAEPAPEPILPTEIAGEVQLRVQLVGIDQYSFDTHPFFQITEDPGFSSASAPVTFINDLGIRNTDEEANVLTKLVHALPPFGIEGVMPLNIPFPRGFGIGFDSAVFSQSEIDAAEGVATIIPITMDLFFYSITGRFYFFNPNEPAVNFFLGASLGTIQGKVRAAPFVGQAAEFISFSQSPVGATRMGLEARGDNIGFRYELILVNAESVTLSKNPYPGTDNNPSTSPTTLIFNGTILRASLYYQWN